MKQKHLTSIFAFWGIFLLALTSFAQNNNTYRYSLDLSKVTDDKVFVTLLPPKIDKQEVSFLMPKMVPGTYKVYDFGRFIEGFEAYDAAGKKLEVAHPNVNEWRISGANQLAKITYRVNDSFDDEDNSNFVFEPAGTNIEAGINYVINTHGFFGYFEGMTMQPFEIEIFRPKFLFGSTSLLPTLSNEEKDIYLTQNYHDLADAPVMYNEPDTVVLKVGGADVLVSVYSPSKKLSAKEVEKEIKEILEAQKNYLGGTLPVERYAFIIYLFKGYFSRSGSYGALEHSYSSFYFLPEAGGSSLAQTIKDVAAHEFFHILTPLNIHSEEIHYFDFNKPVMSKHLWLYEGVTEYFANHMQMYEGLYDATTFFDNMSEKIASSRSNFQDDLSFTQMSKNVLDKYESQYGNVYEKGALIGMCLDVKLRTLSGGKMGLKDLMNELSKKYGKNQPFKDDELFDVITKMTYPEIGEFFRKYVEGSEPLPFAEYFAPLGVVYEEGGEKEVFVIGSVSFALDEARGLLKVSGTWSMTPEDKKTGWRDGDILLEINGKNANISGLKNLVFNDLSKLPAGSKITYKVEREEKGKKKVVTLKGKATKEKTLISHGFSPIDNPTAEQQKLFRAWAFTK